MAKAKEHKSQHYVSKCYLDAWLDPDAPKHMDPYVWLFEREARIGKAKAPKNVFEETDFYTIAAPNGSRDLVFEDGLSELEGRFADIRRRRLDKSISPSEEEGAYLMAFMVAMSFRTKAHREYRRSQWRRILDEMDETRRRASETHNGRVPTVRYSNNPYSSLSRDDVQKLVEEPIQYMLSTEIATYLPQLIGMELLILETDDRVGFITSDDPCIWINEKANARPPVLPELGQFAIMMPASPRQLLYVNPDQSAFARVNISMVTSFNCRTRAHAHEYFVSNHNRTREEWFL